MLIQNKYQLIKKIGTGNYSIVYKAKHINKPEICAIKFDISNNDISKKLLKNEINIYLKLLKYKISNIVNIKSFGIYNKQNYIIMSLLDIDIANYIKKNYNKLNSDIIIDYFFKIHHLLNNMHKNNLIHRDIKPDNFLIKERTGEVFIVDMGISTTYNESKEMKDIIGTPLYSSYNTHLEKYIYKPTDDIISLFYVFFHIIGGSLPWENLFIKHKNVKNYILYYMKKDYDFQKYYKDNILLGKLISTYEYYIQNDKLINIKN